MLTEIPHTLTYDVQERMTVTEVVKSLAAQERLFRMAISVLDDLYPNLHIQRVDVFVQEVSQQSPLRDTLIGAIFGLYGPEIAEEMPDILNKIFGLDVPSSYDGMLSVLVLVIALYGIDQVRAKLFPDKKSKALEDERRALLQIASNQSKIGVDDIERAVEKAVAKQPQSIGRDAIDVLSPARRHSAVAVRVIGGEIGETALKEVPSAVDMAQYEPSTKTETFENVTVVFRAHDLDKSKRWAASIPDVSDDRKPLHLAPDLNPEVLFGRTTVQGNVLVTSVRTPDGEYVPTLYYLEGVAPE